MIRIVPGTGPHSPSTSRAGVGLTEPSATGVWFALGSGERAALRLRTLDRRVALGDRLSYAIHPEGSAGAEPFAATRCAIDLVLDDGTRLSSLGGGIDPVAEHGDALLTVDQWNLRTCSLDIAVGRRIVAAEFVAVGDGSGAVSTCWVSDIRVLPAAEPVRDVPLVDLVDTRRGTHSSATASRGNTVPAVAVPHGFNFGIPVTDAASPRWPYRYHADNDDANRTPFQGFSVSHLPSPWVGDRGIVQIAPVLPGAGADRDGRTLWFRHEDEEARPYVYRVRLSNGAEAQMTATDHVVLVRFRLPEGSGVVVDQLDDDGSVRRASEVLAAAGAHVEGHTDAGATPAPREHFVLRCVDGLASCTTGAITGRPHTSALLAPGSGDDGWVEIRVATSFIDAGQAAHSLELEASDTVTFEDVVARNRSLWELRFRSIEFDCGDDESADDRRRSLAGCLYRMFLYPNDAAENAGTAEQPRIVHRDATRAVGAVRSGASFVNNGFWDTYRTVWPAYALLDPGHCAELLDGFVEHFRASGFIERWSAPGPLDAMVGTSSDVVIADAMAAGVPVLHPEDAYDSLLRNASSSRPRQEVGRPETTPEGFVSTATGEGLSWTLENAISDFGVAVASAWMLDHASADDPRRDEYAANMLWFRDRAMAFVECFEPASGFFVGRRPDGAFRATGSDVDPRTWGGDYTETNAWGMAFTAPHDGETLARLHGGRDGLRRKLDEFFATPETGGIDVAGSFGAVIHEMSEARDVRMGMFGLSNQPAHHIPFMYAFTDAPRRTDRIVREAVRRCFLGSEIGQGYPGDEDNGELSAWFVFAAMGLYPLTPGSGEYLITAPSVRSTTLRFPDGAVTTVRALAADATHDFVQQVCVDGEQWESAALPIALLRRGVDVEIRLGPEPSTWPRGDGPYALSREAVVPRHIRATRTSSGGLRQYRFARATTIACYTVAFDAPDPAREWSVEGFDGSRWRLLDARTDVEYRWPGQTRAFIPTSSLAVTRVRIVFPGDVDASAASSPRLEFFAVDESPAGDDSLAGDNRPAVDA
ncbi:GH92 family glycosyl hydrolase [Humibacter sp.]|uniref:GH92 family glycosyl hydrolase n=1 Tax=Humibacter sp. TaxID=1940291 RepID=UPI002C03D947|nr:GH92 family glycosyl hydrolase [Humibacter sp.]HVX07480.1 GH92 family glycosyl hydrolase [Humibacter sp.]